MKHAIFFLLSLFSFYSFGQSFTEIIKVVAPDRAIQDRFGRSVDIKDDYAIVGAYADDFGETNPNMGSAYIFEKDATGNWAFVQKIYNSDQDDYDRFGWSVAIDGNYAVIGAYAEDHDLFDASILTKSGAAYIFERAADGSWNQIQKIIASDRSAEDEFGWSVDISGTTIVVGAHFESEDVSGANTIYRAGSAYIFEQSIDGSWSETQKIVGSGRAPDLNFPEGGSLQEVSDQFGGDVCISDDYLIVGAHHHDLNAIGTDTLPESGTAYIFEKDAGTWNEVAKLEHSDRETEDGFGFSVSISANFAAVGAPYEDNNLFGTDSLAEAGSVYLFERDIAGNWNETQKIIAAHRNTNDLYGWDLAIDDSLLIVGAPLSNTNATNALSSANAGAAYSYSFNGTLNVWEFTNKLDASDRQSGDRLGGSVGLSDSSVILGAFQQDFDVSLTVDISNAGAAYFYSHIDCTPTTNSQTFTLCAGQNIEVGPNTYHTTGTYTDILTATSGCDSVVTTNLTISPATAYNQTIETCFGYPYNIGSSSYTSSGVYTDILTTLEGCDSIVNTNLTVSPENAVAQDVTICWGEFYTIGASTYNTAGNYTDIITSWALCDCTITTNLTVQLPVDRSISQNLSILSAASPDATYQWITCNPFSIIDGANSQTFVASIVGEYAVIVTEGFCQDTSSCVYVDILSSPQTSPIHPVKIYPNPSNGYFTISHPQATINNPLKGILINNLGQIIKEFSIDNSTYPIDLNNHPKGVYVLKLITHNQIDTYSLIID